MYGIGAILILTKQYTLARKLTTFSCIIIFVFAGTFLIQYCKPKEDNVSKFNELSNEYVGDQQCKSCHVNQYNDWLKSDHFKAIQIPTDSSVLGNFNNSSFSADGVKSHFFKKVQEPV